ncbi:MAG TPA: hypothetical protein VMN56_21285 [Casimicrobiaceae bacterium]|nr:hypothetical protein [Casimicrobiaceae bacterium]
MLRSALLVWLAAALCACGSTPDFHVGGLSLKTEVLGTWKDPKYAAAPLRKVFVISLMKVEPGGRDAVEDAIVARLATAGVEGVASHTVMPKDPDAEGPALEDAIKVSGADGVLLVEVRSVGAIEPYTIGSTVTSLSPDTMASYSYLKGQNVYQPGDYKVARIVSEVYPPSMGKQVWTAFTNSYDASDLARNLSDYTLKLVAVMAKDRIIADAPKPS